MQTIVKSLGEFLSLLVQAFNLSAIFPALVFLALLHQSVLRLLIPGYDLTFLEILSDGGMLATVVIFVVLIAYFLDAANLVIIRLFEGYPLTRFFPFDGMIAEKKSELKTTLWHMRKLRAILDKLIALANSENDTEKKKEILAFAEAVSAHLDDCRQKVSGYPDDPNYILPTRFGNVIAESEEYPNRTFGMDAVTLWPFLRPILTKNHYAEFIMREKAVMDFLLNLIVVLITFGVVFFCTEVWFNGSSPRLWIVTAAIALSCMMLFRLSTVAARSWGVTIRTAFICFREDLRKTLCLRQPNDYSEERAIWEAASEFLQANLTEEEIVAAEQGIFSYKDTATVEGKIPSEQFGEV